jgi:hypothetical protein
MTMKLSLFASPVTPCWRVEKRRVKNGRETCGCSNFFRETKTVHIGLACFSHTNNFNEKSLDLMLIKIPAIREVLCWKIRITLHVAKNYLDFLCYQQIVASTQPNDPSLDESEPLPLCFPPNRRC